MIIYKGWSCKDFHKLSFTLFYIFFSHNISLFLSGKNKDFKKQKGKRSCDVIEIIIYNGVVH